eukprot:CAMPEP_0115023116 /NCGR_PEP_ID=MMETSP0216-20121206/32135_1 /TAXON_ID=223996 /ORGANISM="Protocruzia adherens, Strain Boccale" /LENGTH=458 /DNA_ID=CAMNT_0002396291 /DNA_START=49 /DNA_END=1425 /DNA_ORIENTATION=-
MATKAHKFQDEDTPDIKSIELNASQASDTGQQEQNPNGVSQSFETEGRHPHRKLSHGHRKKRKKASTTRTYFTLFKSFVGIGILALPNAFKQAGIIGGTIGMLVVAAASLYCMELLVRLTDKIGHDKVSTYSDVGRLIYRRYGKWTVDFCILFSQMGFSTSYLIYIGQQTDQVICTETDGRYCGHPEVYIFVTLFVLIPLSLLRSMKHLAIPALIANVAILLGISAIIIFDFIEIQTEAPEVINFKFATLPLFFGIAVFTFEGIGVILNIKDSMEKPEKFQGMLRKTIVVLSCLFIFFAGFSYRAWGEDTKDMITLNLPPGEVVSFIQLFYCVGLTFTYPVMMFPAVDIIESSRGFKNLPSWKVYPRLKNVITRFSLVLLTVAVALGVPNFGLFLNFIGAFACTILAFILPPVFCLKYLDNLSLTEVKIMKGVIIFGVVAGMVSVIVTLKEMVVAFSE